MNITEELKRQVWAKGKIDFGRDPNYYRLDAYGALIEWSMYGNTSSKGNHGWEIDHIIAEANNGSDNLSNLQPLQWYNNRSKGDKKPGELFEAVRVGSTYTARVLHS